MEPEVIQVVISRPQIVVAHHASLSDGCSTVVTAEHFSCPAGLNSVEGIPQAIEEYLGRWPFNLDWVDGFMIAAIEAISNACECAPVGSLVRCLLIIIDRGAEQYVSLCVDNDLVADQPGVLPDLRPAYDFRDHITQERGRGLPIMQALVDGLVVTVCPQRNIQIVLEKDHHPTG